MDETRRRRPARPASIASRFLSTLHPCNHVVRFDPAPTIGDEVYCTRCARYRIVSDCEPEWSIRCLEKGCHHTRYFGSDDVSAKRAAHKHAIRFDHDVRVTRGFRTMSTVYPHGEQETVPRHGRDNTPSVLAWLERNPDHAQSLRRVSDSGEGIEKERWLAG